MAIQGRVWKRLLGAPSRGAPPEAKTAPGTGAASAWDQSVR
jgi:hypothetical protein